MKAEYGLLLSLLVSKAAVPNQAVPNPSEVRTLTSKVASLAEANIKVRN